MGNKIVLASAKMANIDNTTPEIDESGYYKILVGGLNVFNSAGAFYTNNGIEDFYTNKSSKFYERLQNGYLKSEVGHPQMKPGMRVAEFITRNMRIDMANTCAHIKSIELEQTNINEGLPGHGNVIYIWVWLKPSGPHGEALQKALDNKDENVAFSVRSFTKDTVVNGTTIKQLAQVITFDWVQAPGIKYANKWNSVGVEEDEVLSLDINDIMSANNEIAACLECSLESDDDTDIAKELIDNINTLEATIVKRDTLLKW